MFSTNELNSVDRRYFIIYQLNPGIIILKSRNTQHYWRLLSPSSNSSRCTIQHSHHGEYDYHEHGKAGSLKSAIHQIKSHDVYQLTYRKPECHAFDDYSYPILPDSEYFVF